MENQTRKKIKVLRTDNGDEFYEKESKKFCKECGIARQKTTPYTPKQNGVVERMNRSLMEKARNMLIGAGLGQEFWVIIVDTACYLKNRSPTSTLVDKTPYEVWSSQKPYVSHLRVFGFKYFMHVLKEKMRKLDNKCEKCIFVGYKEGIKGYKLWNIVSRKVVYSRDVVFGEVKNNSRIEDEPKGPKKIEFEIMDEGVDSVEEELLESKKEVDLQTPTLRRYDHEQRLVDRYSPPNFHSAFLLSIVSDETISVKEVVNSEECKLWKNAMVEEMEALRKNEASNLLELPDGRKHIGSKWVFKKKLYAAGKVEKYKA